MTTTAALNNAFARSSSKNFAIELCNYGGGTNRGIYAQRDFFKGEKICIAYPLVAEMNYTAADTAAARGDCRGRCPFCFRLERHCLKHSCLSASSSFRFKSTSYRKIVAQQFDEVNAAKRETDGNFQSLILKLAIRTMLEPPSSPISTPALFTMQNLCYAKINPENVPRDEYENILSMLRTLNLPSSEFLTFDLYLRFLSILHLNTFRFTDARGGTGSALYGAASFFNHSCEPNSESRFNGACMEVVAGKSGIRRGEEIFTCYDYSDDVVGGDQQEERHERLVHNYGFRCECRLCREII